MVHDNIHGPCRLCGRALGGQPCDDERVEARRPGPRLHLAGQRRQDLSPGRLPRQRGGRLGLVSQGIHARLHQRVQVVPRRRRALRKFAAAYFTASVDPAEKNHKFAESVAADYPILSDPGGEVARAYGVTSAVRPVAQRWTFYIGVDGKILFIDKAVQTASHAADVAAKLKELGVAEKKAPSGPR